MTIDQRSDQMEALLTERMTADAVAAEMGVHVAYARRILRRLHQQRRVRPAGTIRQRGTRGLLAMEWERWTQ